MQARKYTTIPDTLFCVRVTGPPVPQGRANVTRHGTYYTTTSNDYREALVMAYANLYTGPVIAQPIWVTCKIKGGNDAADLDNIAKQAMDALQEAEVIANDNRKVVKHLTIIDMDGYPDPLGDDEYLEVVIEPFDGFNLAATTSGATH